MLAITSELKATVNNFSLFQKLVGMYNPDYFNTYRFGTIMNSNPKEEGYRADTCDRKDNYS